MARAHGSYPISVKDSDGVTNTLIWDVESITDIVS